MKSNYAALMQSRFFNPAFNSAIFDGPVRIYFSQFHESVALKIYFALQEAMPGMLRENHLNVRDLSQNVLIMLYPNAESFGHSFDHEQGPKVDASTVASDVLDADHVIGVCTPVEDQTILDIVAHVRLCIRDLAVKTRPQTADIGRSSPMATL